MKSLKVGPVNYRLEERIMDIGQAAVHTTSAAIHVDKGLDDQMKRISIWHEVLHAILAHAGYREHPEDLIEALSYGIVGVLNDNPGAEL